MVADRLQDMFESRCCDGFVICPSISPGTYSPVGNIGDSWRLEE